MSAAPVPLRLYRALSRLLAGPAWHRTRLRLAAGGMPARRIAERQGRASLPRPEGPLIWFHGASVGEGLSILPLVEALLPDAAILVTTGTASSATLLGRRLPDGALHQFAPLDSPGAVAAFLDHWRPGAGVFVESEIWPNMLTQAHSRGIPLALVNARMSDRSLARWARMPTSARHLFGMFDRITTQDARTRDGLTRMLGDPGRVTLGGNMKPAAAPLPHDPAALADWRARLDTRPVWIASSTHAGEDPLILAAQCEILESHPDTLMILVPRHPERGADIARLAARSGLRTARLGAGEPVEPATQVLVADTIGDLGLWYRLSPIVCLAGSFGPAGGHNPWEAIGLGAALLHGPEVPNAAPDYAELDAAGAACEVADAPALARAVGGLLSDPGRLDRMRRAASASLRGADDLVQRVAADLRALLAAPR